MLLIWKVHLPHIHPTIAMLQYAQTPPRNYGQAVPDRI